MIQCRFRFRRLTCRPARLPAGLLARMLDKGAAVLLPAVVAQTATNVIPTCDCPCERAGPSLPMVCGAMAKRRRLRKRTLMVDMPVIVRHQD